MTTSENDRWPWESDHFAPTTWIMAGGMDIRNGLQDRCAEAAAGMLRDEYVMTLERQNQNQRPDKWLVPKAPFKDALPEIRIHDDPVRVRHHAESVVIGMVARALTGTIMCDDEASRALSALRAVVASEGLMDRCAPARRRILRAGMATTWGPACARDLTFGFSGPNTSMRPSSAMHAASFPIDEAVARILPVCTSIGFRDEPGHIGHIRVEPVSLGCTDDNAPDAMETMRIMADLMERPFA